MENIPRFKAAGIEQGRESVVGSCNGHSCEERWDKETPAFARAILKHLPKDAYTVIDYGCGMGRLAKEVLRQNPKVTILGVDASEAELHLASDYVNDARFIPMFPEDLRQKADLLYCIYVLQHVPAIELRHAIERMHYFLKPGGKLVYCSSDYRMAINQNGAFTDDAFLGVNIRKELERLFEEEAELFDLSAEDQIIRDMVTAKGCPPGSIPHPAKVYKRRDVDLTKPYFMALPQTQAAVAERTPSENGKPPINAKSPAMRLILQNRLSPGDCLVMTAAIRSLHLAYPGRFLTDVESACPEIFWYNPHLTSLQGDGQRIDMHYPLISDHTLRGFKQPGCGISGRHFSDGHRKYLEEVLEIEIPRSGLVPELYLSQDEKLWPSPVLKEHGYSGHYWVINAGVKSDFTLKQYHRWQEVVDLLKDSVQFVQIGVMEHNHKPLAGVLDMRGKTDHRALYRLIYHADGVLDGVSYPHHIAAAFQKPCVVVAGGREPVFWESYPNQRYLAVNGAIPCALWDGCWKSKLEDCLTPTDFDGSQVPKCMDMIKPSMIAEAVEMYYEGGILQKEEVHA